MKDRELGWLAGLLEGEGCFCLMVNKTNGRRYIKISLDMTDEDTVKRASEYAGVGTLGGPYSRGSNKSVWIWQVQKQADAAALMMMLFPLMGQRRQDKISELLTIWKAGTNG